MNKCGKIYNDEFFNPKLSIKLDLLRAGHIHITFPDP
jgi:hypothetical protein